MVLQKKNNYKKINKQKAHINFSKTVSFEAEDTVTNNQNIGMPINTFVDYTEHAETQVVHEFKAGRGYGRFFRDHIYSSELPQLKLSFIYTSLVYTLKS